MWMLYVTAIIFAVCYWGLRTTSGCCRRLAALVALPTTAIWVVCIHAGFILFSWVG